MDNKGFIVRILETLKNSVFVLEGKIQAGAVDYGTEVPFAAFTVPEERPIRSKSGIVGYTVNFEVSVYHNRVGETEYLRHAVIHALEGADLGDGYRASYRSSFTEYYPDYDLHGATLNFRIIHFENY